MNSHYWTTRQGKWKTILDVSSFFSSDIPIRKKVKLVGAILTESPFEDDVELGDLAYEFTSLAEDTSLSEDELADEFDLLWDQFYDWCDQGHRVWVEINGTH